MTRQPGQNSESWLRSHVKLLDLVAAAARRACATAAAARSFRAAAASSRDRRRGRSGWLLDTVGVVTLLRQRLACAIGFDWTVDRGRIRRDAFGGNVAAHAVAEVGTLKPVHVEAAARMFAGREHKSRAERGEGVVRFHGALFPFGSV